MNCSVDFRRRQQARYIKKVRQNLDITLGAPLRTLFGNQSLKISYIIRSKIKAVLFRGFVPTVESVDGIFLLSGKVDQRLKRYTKVISICQRK